MPIYTYGPLPVLITAPPGQPNDVYENATGGVFYQTVTDAADNTSPLPIFDLNLAPIDEITSGPTGLAQWASDQAAPNGFVKFGDIVNAVHANEVGPLLASLDSAVADADAARVAAEAALAAVEAYESSGGITDHGALSGLADDDHTQYLNNARGDIRYYTKSQVDTATAAAATANSLADRNRANHSGTQPISSIEGLSEQIGISGLVQDPDKPAGFYRVGTAAPPPPSGTSDPNLFFAKTTAAKNSTKKAFTHILGLFAPGLTETDDWWEDWTSMSPDFPNQEYQAAFGGRARNRPWPRPVPRGGDFELEDAKNMVTWALEAGWDGFTCDVTTVGAGDNWRRYTRLVDAAVAINSATGSTFKVLPDLDGSSNTGVQTQTPAALCDGLTYFWGPPGSPKSSTHMINGKIAVGSFKADGFSYDYWNNLLAEANSRYPVGVVAKGVFLSVNNIPNYIANVPGMVMMGQFNPGSDPAFVQGKTLNRDAAVAAGRLWMTPALFQESRPEPAHGQWWREANNTQTLRDCWNKKVVADDPAEIHAITWNDFAEGSSMMPSVTLGHGANAIQAYYIEKWKTGVAPPILRDALFLSHRDQFTTLPNSAFTGGQTIFMTLNTASSNRTPPRDMVELLCYLTAAGTVTINAGGTVTTFSAPAGESVHTVPLKTGTISATLARNGTTLATITSPFTVTNTPLVQDLEYKMVTNIPTNSEPPFTKTQYPVMHP